MFTLTWTTEKEQGPETIIIKGQKQTKIETNLVGRKARKFNSGGENMRHASGHQDKNERKLKKKANRNTYNE